MGAQVCARAVDEDPQLRSTSSFHRRPFPWYQDPFFEWRLKRGVLLKNATNVTVRSEAALHERRETAWNARWIGGQSSRGRADRTKVALLCKPAAIGLQFTKNWTLRVFFVLTIA